MEKKNNRFYFESYEEIKSFISQNLPTEVYMPAVRSAVIHGGCVVADRQMHKQKPQATVESPFYVGYDGFLRSDLVTLGCMTDFPATDYAVTFNPEPHVIEAATMLEGLYQAGDDLAAKMHTGQNERREVFTAKELTLEPQKGGAVVDYPDDAYYIYRIKAATGQYDVAAMSLFEVIDRAEKALNVATAKRRRFTILPEKQDEKQVVACIEFDADAVLGKLRACCANDELRPVMQQPALDIKRKVMVATDGKVLAVYKPKNLRIEIMDGPEMYDPVCLPLGVCQMKGTVSVEVVWKEWEEHHKVNWGKDVTRKVSGLFITATDSQGRHSEVRQTMRYPNWAAVIPSNLGPAIPIDAKVMASAIRRILPSLNSCSGAMKVSAKMGDDCLTLSGNDYEYETEAMATVPIEGGMPVSVRCSLCSRITLPALAFCPTEMRYISYMQPVLFFGKDSLVMQMPMRIESEPTDDGGKLKRFDMEKWLASESAPERKAQKAKSEKVKKLKGENGKGEKAAALSAQSSPSNQKAAAAKPSFAELLRKALLAA